MRRTLLHTLTHRHPPSTNLPGPAKRSPARRQTPDTFAPVHVTSPPPALPAASPQPDGRILRGCRQENIIDGGTWRRVLCSHR